MLFDVPINEIYPQSESHCLLMASLEKLMIRVSPEPSLKRCGNPGLLGEQRVALGAFCSLQLLSDRVLNLYA